MTMTSMQKYIFLAGIFLICSGMGLYVYLKEFSPKYTTKETKFDYFKNKNEDEQVIHKIRQADIYLQQKSRESSLKAHQLFNEALSYNLSPELKEKATYGLAKSLENLNEIPSALNLYQKLKTEGILDSELGEKIDFALGKIYLEIQKQNLEGVSILKALLARITNNDLKSDIHTVFGNYYLRNGNSNRAKQNYIIALKYNPDNIQAQLGLDSIKESKLSKKNTQTQTSPVIIQEPKIPEKLKDSPVISPETKSTEPDIELKKESKTDDINKIYRSGLINYKKENFVKALHDFKKVIKLSKDDLLNEKAMYWLAECHLSLGNLDEADKHFNSVVENNMPDMDQPAFIKKGIIMFQKKQYKKAAAYFLIAADNFQNQTYSAKANEWLRETEAQIRENSGIKDLDNDIPKKTN